MLTHERLAHEKLTYENTPPVNIFFCFTLTCFFGHLLRGVLCVFLSLLVNTHYEWAKCSHWQTSCVSLSRDLMCFFFFFFTNVECFEASKVCRLSNWIRYTDTVQCHLLICGFSANEADADGGKCQAEENWPVTMLLRPIQCTRYTWVTSS